MHYSTMFRFVVMLCIYCLHSNPSDCKGGLHLQVYILILLVLNSMLILLCSVTSYISSRGTILSGNSRRQIPTLIYLRCPLILFEVVWNIVGTVWIFSSTEDCDSHVVAAVKFTVIVGWLVLFGFLVSVWLIFDPLGNVHHSELKLTSQRAKKLWKFRLQLAFLCASRDDNAKAAFEDVAELLTDFFLDTDLVLSDVWAGLLMLVNEEFRLMTERRKPLECSLPPPDWMNVNLASRMMDFALGVYGWPYYVWNKCTPSRIYHLIQKMKCCGAFRCDQVLVLKDNCCMCNTAAFTLLTDIGDVDLFHVSFKNKIYEVPYVACADPKTSSVVIAIRGSMSLRDVVTDLCVSDESLLLEDAGYFHQQPVVSATENCFTAPGQQISPDIRVHRGILNSAKYVFNSLLSQNIVEDLMVLYPDYDLVVTGHSLGAGVAAVVAMLLKPKFPNVRCFAFSPPGCVFSENILPQTQQFICSVVIGDDLVPRLSYQSMRELKRSILNAIENCEQAKYEILLKGCFKLLCGSRQYSRVEHDIEAPPDPVITPTRGSTSMDQPLLRGGSRSGSSSYTSEPLASPSDRRVSLHLPGRIMHISASPLESESRGCCSPFLSPPVESQLYSTVWSDYTKFEQIKLSSRMVADHWPFRVADILKFVSEQTGSPESLSF